MLNRAMKAVLLSAGVGGIIFLLVSVGPEGFRRSTTPLSRTTRTAYAQNPGAPVRYAIVTERSEARYRVREQLAGFDLPNDAVGATNAIEGSISLDANGRVLPGDSRFTVDLRRLQSDKARRDNYIRRNTLETDRHPTAVLVPLEVRGLPFPLPQTGAAAFELVGDLTVRDVTRRLAWQTTATFNGHELDVRARTAFRFADFGLPVPRVAVVLSVEDHIELEADLVLRQGS
jgi:polyisoprenoid-binding protein YceI